MRVIRTFVLRFSISVLAVFMLSAFGKSTDRLESETVGYSLFSVFVPDVAGVGVNEEPIVYAKDDVIVAYTMGEDPKSISSYIRTYSNLHVQDCNEIPLEQDERRALHELKNGEREQVRMLIPYGKTLKEIERKTLQAAGVLRDVRVIQVSETTNIFLDQETGALAGMQYSLELLDLPEKEGIGMIVDVKKSSPLSAEIYEFAAQHCHVEPLN